MAERHSAQLAIQKKLNAALIDAQVRNPAFSLRAFARRLELSPSALSEILNGKRSVSKKVASRLVRKLCLSPDEGHSLLRLFPKSKAEAETTPVSPSYLRLTTDQFHLISEWFHFAILSLAETEDFVPDSQWIARRLNVSVTQAKVALTRLERLGLLATDSKGRLVPTGAQFATPDEVSDVALRMAHARNLELARTSLDEDTIETRDFTATTMAIDISKMKVAKQMIREFQDQLSAYLETGPRTEVYKLSIQFIPLTHRKDGPDESKN